MRTVTNRQLILLLAALTALTGCERGLEERAGAELISQFGQGCRSKGHWTDQAIAQNEAFQNALEELKKKSECKGMESQLTAIAGLSKSVQRFGEDQAYKRYLSQQSQLTDMTSINASLMPEITNISHQLPSGLVPVARQLGPVAGGLPAMAASYVLHSAFDKVKEIKLQKAKASAAGSGRAGELSESVFAENSGQFVSNLQGMIAEMKMPEFRKCLQQSPVAAAQLAVQLMAVTGDASSPANGAALGSIAQVMNFALNLQTDEAKIEKVQFKNQKNLMPLGLSCALESMTEVYCDAEDARELMVVQAIARERDKERLTEKSRLPVEPIWRGMYILSRTLPVIAKTLREIRNGNKPSDGFDSQRQNAVWAKVITLDSTYRDVIGSMGKLETMYNGTQDANSRRSFIVQALREASSLIDSSPVYTEVLSTEQKVTICMLAKDGPDSECPVDLMKDGSLDLYIRNRQHYNTTFEKMRKNWELMVVRASKAVEQELALQIVIDPDMAIVGMHEPIVDNVSPIEAFKIVREFLESLKKLSKENPDADWNPELERALDDTRDRLDVVIDGVYLASINPEFDGLDPKARAQIIITKIYEAFQLRIGVQFLTERVRKFVEWDLNRRLKLGQFPSKASDILAQWGGEVAARIVDQKGDLQDQLDDLNSAQFLTQANLQTFLGYFTSDAMNNALVEATKTVLKSAENSNEPLVGQDAKSRQVLAKLCILSTISYEGRNAAVNKPLASWFEKTGAESFNVFCNNAVLTSALAKPVTSNDPFSIHQLPLTLSYNTLYALFSGQKSLYGFLSGAAVSVLPAQAAGESSEGIYGDIFNRVVFGRTAQEEMKFPRKVCTYHRFLRAGRILQALPTMDPQFVKAIAGGLDK